jgi:hypothetical protein
LPSLYQHCFWLSVLRGNLPNSTHSCGRYFCLFLCKPASNVLRTDKFKTHSFGCLQCALALMFVVVGAASAVRLFVATSMSSLNGVFLMLFMLQTSFFLQSRIVVTSTLLIVISFFIVAKVLSAPTASVALYTPFILTMGIFSCFVCRSREWDWKVKFFVDWDNRHLFHSTD